MSDHPLFTDDDVERVARVVHNAEWELDTEEDQREFIQQATAILDAVLPAIRKRWLNELADEWEQRPGDENREVPEWLRLRLLGALDGGGK